MSLIWSEKQKGLNENACLVDEAGFLTYQGQMLKVSKSSVNNTEIPSSDSENDTIPKTCHILFNNIEHMKHIFLSLAAGFCLSLTAIRCATNLFSNRDGQKDFKRFKSGNEMHQSYGLTFFNSSVRHLVWTALKSSLTFCNNNNVTAKVNKVSNYFNRHLKYTKNMISLH